MNILLCNDDGYNAKGITLLYEKLKKYGNVTICAPEHHMSGKSCSINIGVGLELKQHSSNVFSFSGTPADCVAFALSSMDKKFDLVVSGCNDGLNISYDTMYSGTIGVCLEALRFRVPAIAFSCEHNFEIVNEYFDMAMNYVLEHKYLSTEYFCNVNFPLGKVVKKIELGRLYYRNDKSYFEKSTKDGLYYVGRVCDNDLGPADADTNQVMNGIISVVPLSKTFFDDRYLKKLK